jgi:hypothetical protein
MDLGLLNQVPTNDVWKKPIIVCHAWNGEEVDAKGGLGQSSEEELA